MNVGTESVASFFGKPPLKREMPQKLKEFFKMNTRQSNSRHAATTHQQVSAIAAPMGENTGNGPGGHDL